MPRSNRMKSFKLLILKCNKPVILLLGMMAFSFLAEAQLRTANDLRTRQSGNSSAFPIESAISDTAKKIIPPSRAAIGDSIKPNPIEAEIAYKANDSIILLGNGTAFLHGQTEMNYQQINLKADFIRVKLDSSLIYAKGTKDENGEKIGEPIFTEGESSYNSKEMMYNLKTRKGFIRQVVTQEGEGYIISDKTKKASDNSFCIADGKYTTCDHHDHPDFYLSISKGKIKPGEYIVAGPAHLVVADVPLPIAIPFGFFPFSQKYSSGILMPSFKDEQTRGFGLTNGGYYFAISDYMDLELRGDIYTKGTWSLSANSGYLKKYKYRGNFSISYREDVTGEKGFSDYAVANNMSIRWTHSQDAKANPNFTFSSSVNFSTSGYNRSNIDSYYRPDLNSENTKSSSVSFTKRFSSIPSLNISGSMLINQRTKDSTINLTLPNVSISYSRFYPLKRKNPVGKERWYEKISMSYSGTLANSIDTKEDKLLSSSFTRDWKNGMKHSVPISANFNVLKYINISPSINYTERWYLRSVEKSWDMANQKELNDTTDGFYRVFDFNMGVSASTKLYAFYEPLKSIFGDKVDRIRHVITPNIGFSYTPDFGDPLWGYYDSYIKTVATSDPTVFNESEVRYSRFAGSLYGTPGTGKSGSINFSLGNNVEMKIKNKNDTTATEAFKKISLIDNLSFSGSYNLAADSMQWSMFSASLRLKITKNYSLSLSTSFDPYMYALNSSGNPVRVNKLRWEHGQFPRFQGTGTSFAYTFNNDTFKKLFGKKDQEAQGNQPDGTSPEGESDRPENEMPQQGNMNPQGKNSTDKEVVEADPDGYEKIAIPWSFSFNYSVRYMNSTFNKEKMEYDMKFTHNLGLNGNISLTSNWKISASSSYDFTVKEFTSVSVSVNRSLHCWSMSASFVPFGRYKSYNFHIGVNASMLADLKYDKRSAYSMNNITWY